MANNNYTAIPSELTTLPQWVLWDRRNKAPLTIRGANASVTNPHTWATFEQALDALKQAKGPVGGIGFVLTPDDPYCVIDLDHCVDYPEMQGWAADIHNGMQSYSEYSPSGTGLHIWIKAKLPGTRRRTGSFEIYDSERYLTVTGNPVGGECGFSRIESRQQEVNALCQRMFRAEESHPVAEIDNIKLSQVDPPISVIACLTENIQKFKMTWEHQRSDLASQSEYDCSIAHWLVNAGCTQSEIAAAIAWHRHKGGKDPSKAYREYRNGTTYISRILAKIGGR